MTKSYTEAKVERFGGKNVCRTASKGFRADGLSEEKEVFNLCAFVRHNDGTSRETLVGKTVNPEIALAWEKAALLPTRQIPHVFIFGNSSPRNLFPEKKQVDSGSQQQQPSPVAA